MELQRVLHMSGGEGDTSYAKNSSYQVCLSLFDKHTHKRAVTGVKLVLTKVKPVLEQCIQELLRTNLPYNKKCIRVADLGCSSGPNTLLTVSDIIQSIDKVSQEMDNEFALPTIQGRLEEEKLDSFNVPIYTPSVEEVRHIIEEEGSFEIVCLETFKLRHDAGFSIDDNQLGSHSQVHFCDEHVRAAHVASMVRAVSEPILASHFGEAIIPDLFHRFAKNAAKLLP
nr:probable caffeine synthase 4 isoform X1 [Coffea arabica]